MIGDAADMLDRLQKGLPPWFDQVLLAASPEPAPTPTDTGGTLDFSDPDNSDLIASAG